MHAPIVCLGETLWDVLPHGAFLGGAPFNVAAHLARLGAPVCLVSRVGADARGREALARMRAVGLGTARVQVDPWLPTGEARAVLDGTGSARYEFPSPAAWDRIEADAHALEAANGASALVFGTLSQRTPAAVEAVRRLVDAACWRVLDLNLRAPHDQRDVALASLARADFVKLNDSEADRVAAWLGVAADPPDLLDVLAARFGVASLCITRGERGAVLWHDGQWFDQPAARSEVIDTVGAGDAFLAMLLAELLDGRAPATAMERAARLAAFVASQPGAVPDYAAGVFRG